jgi:hypothetical protein
MVTAVEVATLKLETVKLAAVVPWATVTAAGTLAAEALLLTSETLAPPEGAEAESVTFPVREVPPTTLDVLSDSEASVDGAGTGLDAGPTASDAESFAFKDSDPALMVTACELETV